MRKPGSGRRVGCLAAIGAVIVVAGLLAVFRQPAGRFVVGLALKYIGRALHGRIEYERLSGNIFTHPRFEGAVVVFGSDSVKAQELSFSYDPFGLLRGTVPLYSVEIREPIVYITTEPGPAAGSRAKARARASYPKLNLRMLHVTGGALFLNGEPRVESLELALAVVSWPSELRARLMQAGGRLVKEKVSVRSVSARCRMNPDSLFLEQLTVSTLNSTLRGDVKLAFDGSGASAVLENLSVDLPEFLHVPGRFRAKGRAGLAPGRRTGDVDYTADGLGLQGVRLPRISGRLALVEPELRVSASGQDPDLGRFNLEGGFDTRLQTYEVQVSLRDVRVKVLRPGLPDVLVDADLQASGRKIDSVRVELGARVIGLGIDTLQAAGTYSPDRVRVDRFEAKGPSGWLWMSGDWRLAKGGFRVTDLQCAMDSLDLGLAAQFLRVQAAGRLKGLVSGSGSLDSFELRGGVRALGLEVGGLRFGQGQADFDMAVGRGLHGRLVVGVEKAKGMGLDVDAAQVTLQDSGFDLRIDRPLDRLLAGGAVRLARDGVRCDVSRFQFATRDETLALDEPFTFAWSPDSLEVRGVRCQVAGGTLELDLSRSAGSSPELTARGANLDLGRLRKLFRFPFEVSGEADFEVSGQDSFAVKLSARNVELPAVGMSLEDLAADLTASATRATIARLWFVQAVDTTTISGSFSYDLSHGFALKDVDVQADIAGLGTWPFFFMKRTLDLSGGQLYGQVRWQGGLSEPNLEGRLRVVMGTLSVPAVNTTVERVNAELTAKADRIVLEKLSGVSGGGLITAAGFVDLGQNWQVDSLRYRIRPDGATISPLPEVYAVVAGDVSIAWAAGRPFSIEGTVEVEEALLAFGFGQGFGQSSAVGGGGADSVVYDLKVRGERGIWLRNPMADIEVSVDLSLRKTMTEETYSGQLSSRQGNIYYLDHTLKVTHGVIRFDNINRINPELDIQAELPVSARLRSAGTAPDRIILTLTGTLEKPEFEFAADPPGWDESQIITYLSLNVTADELEGLESRQAATRYLSERLLGYFQTQATKRVRKFIGLDELRFESAFTGGEGYKVTVGKYVGRNLYFTYTQNFTGVLQPAFTVEYYLNHQHEIIGEKTEAGLYSVRYGFRLRY